ncbi:MAG: AAA family ATPase [Bacteroidales bacterium]|nr:AAA family ATPase [Bacteroidales bacterium]
MRQINIAAIITANLDYKPTVDQEKAIVALSEYVAENSNDSLFLLTGYAGTGKTSIISALVKSLEQLRLKSVLLAPTGRAAKVLASYSGRQAFTIHKKIYRQKSSRDGVGTFSLDRNLHKETFFIIDEASMINNRTADSSIFGSGRVLDDLFEYVYSGSGCKLILVGDTAQLPPVGSDVSPALDQRTLESYGFGVTAFELKEVVRQAASSGILMNATGIRRIIGTYDAAQPQIDTDNFNDIIRIGGDGLIDELQAAYEATSKEETIVVVNSNKMANKYNQGIRNRIFFREDEVGPGDLLMVVKNNYFWLSGEEQSGFIANGDIAEVVSIGNYEERYGFRFAEVSLFFPDYQEEIDAKIVLDTLHYDTPAMPEDKSRELYFSVLEDYPGLKSKKKQYEAVREDPYFNALQVKFAYAVTCHKAQGGQWRRVFIDQGMFNSQEPTTEYLRWLYTALTRATEKLYLVNFQSKFFSEQ